MQLETSLLTGLFVWVVPPDVLYGDGVSVRDISADLTLRIIEGIVTILYPFTCFWLFPNKPENMCFLNAKNKENMVTRAE